MQTKMDRRIVEAYHYGTRQQLVEIQTELLNSQKKVGEFIDRFLDKFDNKMSYAPPEDPTWKLFRAKHAEYGELERLVKSVNYFLAKS